MEKKLYRSKKERILLGVCGGIAEYFSVDPTIVRLILILLIFTTGPLLPLLYLISALIIPPAPDGEEIVTPHKSSREELWGWILLGLGVFLLALNLGCFFIPFRIAVPLFILLLGVILLLKRE
ncbi:MAG: PspC domain-containing protein [Dictyoglomaceae bacterium]